MLDPVKLRVLLSVVETGSIRASAEALGYTPSAVSQHLSALRRDLGIELAERSGRGIVVTPAAREIATAAAPALDALAEVERLARELRAGRTGRLQLGYSMSVGALWIPKIAEQMRDAFPELALDLSVRECRAPDVAGQLDMAVVDAGAMPYDAGWSSIDVLEEGYVALVGVDHPLADRAEVAIGELADLPWATDDPLDSAWFDVIASACRAAGFSPRIEVNPSDITAVLGFVAAGPYVSVQPSLVCQRLRSDVVSVPISGDRPRRRLQVRVRDAVAQHAPARHVLALVREICRETAAEVPGMTAL